MFCCGGLFLFTSTKFREKEVKHNMEIQDEVFDAEQMGRQLKKLRNASKLSQERFAERLGMSRDTIYNYEKGKIQRVYFLIAV